MSDSLYPLFDCFVRLRSEKCLVIYDRSCAQGCVEGRHSNIPPVKPPPEAMNNVPIKQDEKVPVPVAIVEAVPEAPKIEMVLQLSVYCTVRSQFCSIDPKTAGGGS